ncbi:MAG: flagellar biosynthetic protein FliO [Vicinamibacterales bacterium]
MTAPEGPSLLDGAQSLTAVLIVFGLLAVLVWVLKRGPFGLRAGQRAGIAVESAVPLGDRRSLVVVAVEGRRLLLGVTPGQVSFVTELAGASFAGELDRRLEKPGPTAGSGEGRS